jgi:hypothetical protein
LMMKACFVRNDDARGGLDADIARMIGGAL